MDKYRIDETYPDLTPGQQLEEAIAAAFADHMTRKTEPNDPPLRRAIRRAATFFRALGRALRGAGVQDTGAIFGHVASRAVGRLGGRGGRGGREQASQGATGGIGAAQWLSRPTERQRVERQIRGVLAGTAVSEPIALTSSPPVIAELSGGKAPVVVSQDAIWKANDKHGMTARQIIQAMANLSEPVMVFDGATTAESLVALVDVEGIESAVVIALHMNQRVGRIEVTRIASIHKKRSADQVMRWIGEGLTR